MDFSFVILNVITFFLEFIFSFKMFHKFNIYEFKIILLESYLIKILFKIFKDFLSQKSHYSSLSNNKSDSSNEFEENFSSTRLFSKSRLLLQLINKFRNRD